MDEASLARQIDRVETARANGNKTRSLMLMRMCRVLTREQRDALRADVQAMGHASGGRRPVPALPPAPKPGRAPRASPAPSDSQRRPG